MNHENRFKLIGSYIAIVAALCAGLASWCSCEMPCTEQAALLNSATVTSIRCDTGRLVITQVATGQLARCVCGADRDR